TQVLWTATDIYGNASTAIQNIVVGDTVAPTITAPADVYTEALGVLTTVVIGTATAIDTVDAAPVITSNTPATFPVGTTVVIWTATDVYGNASTATQNLMVGDTVAPTITAPADVYVEALGVLTTVVIGTATAIDTVDAAPVISSNKPATFPVGTTVVIWTATDIYGNAATATQNIVVGDTIAPTIIAPADVYVEALGVLTTVVIGTATAIDTVDAAPVISSNKPATFPVGITQVIWTATDIYGNASTATQNIVVGDTVAPTITAPANITIAAVDAYGTPATDPYITAFLNGATASDLVSGVLVASPYNAPTTFPIGATIVSFNATDAYSNISTGTATVTVTDQSAPSITPPVNTTVTASSVGGALLADVYVQAFLNAGTALDSVDGVLPVSPYAAPAFFAFGDTIIIFTATDAQGNTNIATATLTVVHSQPVITSPASNPYSLLINEDSYADFIVVTNDVDGDTVFYSVASNALNGTLAVGSLGSVHYVPDANYFGSDLFSLQIIDTYSAPVLFDVYVTVVTVNDAPVFSSPVDHYSNPTGVYNITLVEDNSTNFTVTANDLDSASLTFINTPASKGAATVDSFGNVSYTPSTNVTGADSFTVSVFDSYAAIDTLTVNINITPANDAPTVTATAITTNEDTSGSSTATGVDVDGDTLNYSIDTAPANGTASVDAYGSINYTPYANFNGTDYFSVQVFDGYAFAALPADVYVTITAVNDIPVITLLGNLVENINTGIVYNDAGATATDIEDGNISASIITVNPVNTSVAGTYTISYNVTDSYGAAATQISRTINVINNIFPVGGVMPVGWVQTAGSTASWHV
ncbi:MAG: tandem-95 repeat protein, partial [Mariprofundales bacterium]